MTAAVYVTSHDTFGSNLNTMWALMGEVVLPEPEIFLLTSRSGFFLNNTLVITLTAVAKTTGSGVEYPMGISVCV